QLFTRKGLDWTDKFTAIAKAARALPDGLYDGEIVALDAHSRPDFAGLQAALSNGRTGGLVFFLFDLLHDGTTHLLDRPLVERKAALEAILKDVDPDGPLRFVEHFSQAGKAVLESACRMDLEGVVSKRLDAPHSSGRAGTWLQAKCSGPLRFLAHFSQAGKAVLESACRMDLERVVSKRLDAPYRSGRSDTWLKAKCGGGQEVIIAGYATTKGAFRSLIAAVRRDDQLVH